MNAEEFDTFSHALRSPVEGAVQGYYPQMPWNDRIAVLWFQTLKRFPAAKVMRALDLHQMVDPKNPPTLDAVLRDVKALIPPAPQPWQQFPQEQEQAMRRGGYGAVLETLILPEPNSQAWAKCWIWLWEQELTFPGREGECAQECRRFADLYPRDRDDWLRHARRLQEEATRHPQKPPKIQRENVPLGLLSAPRLEQAPHPEPYDHTFGGHWLGAGRSDDDELTPRE